MSTILEQQEQTENEEIPQGIPICGGNYATPVIDVAHYTGEIKTKVGNRLYISNAD